MKFNGQNIYVGDRLNGLIDPSNLNNSHYDKFFRITVKPTAGSTGFAITPTSGLNYNCRVFWGDGSSDFFTGYDDPNWTHYYASGGTYQISINGIFPRFNVDPADDIKIYSIDNWGHTKMTSLENSFLSCINLEILPDKPISLRNEITTIDGAFEGCYDLDTYYENNGPFPENVFQNMSKVETAEGLFAGANIYPQFPQELFAPLINVKNFNYLFSGCDIYFSGYTGYDKSIFHHNTGVTGFRAAFYNCREWDFLFPMSGIFDTNTEVTDFSFCFENYNCSRYKNPPPDLFKYNTKAETFEGCFRGVYADSWPSNLFDNLTSVTNFKEVFYTAYYTVDWGSDLFSGCSGAETFEGAFNSCSFENYYTGTGRWNQWPSTFAGCVNAKDFNRVFYGCAYSWETKVPSGVFKDCVNATGFVQAFAGFYITGVPDDLFAYCTGALDFTQCFENASLQEVPANFFANNTLATGFVETFASCEFGIVNSGVFSNTKGEDFYRTFYAASIDSIKSGGIFPSIAKTFEETFRTNPMTSLPADLFSGVTGATNFYHTFYGCSSLVELPAGLFDDCAEATYFYGTFRDCNFTSIPEGFFDNCPKADNFGFCFYSVNNLANIPSGLFANNTGATSMRYTFYGDSISHIPTGLFDNNNEVTTFSNIFEACDLVIAGIPTGLFANKSKMVSAEGIFRANPFLDGVPESIFEGSTGITTFAKLFEDCSTLDFTGVPTGLFSTNVNAIIFSNVFDNTAITGIPENIFRNNINAGAMDYAFYSCNNLREIPATLFSGLNSITTMSYTFYDCDSSFLETIPSGLFDTNSNITNFSSTFYYCDDIENIPSGLFDNNLKASNFASTFRYCTSLRNVQYPLFLYNTGVTSCSYVFANCTLLTGVHPKLFNGTTGCTNFANCFQNATLNTDSYSDLLVEFELTHPLSNGTFHGGNSKYDSVAQSARDALTGRGWTITDGGTGADYLDRTPLQLTVNTTLDGVSSTSGFKLPTTSTATYNCTVYWGDGQRSTITSYNDPDITHIYASTGIYTVKIVGEFGRIYFNNANDDDKILSVDSWTSNSSFNSFVYAFNGCSALTGVVGPILGGDEVTNFASAFLSCTSLTSIPSGLFDNNTGATGFVSTFMFCNSIPFIDHPLFLYNTEVTSFAATFGYNISLTGVHSQIFNGATGCVDFASCFQGIDLDTDSYSDLLVEFESTHPLSNGIFHGGGSNYNSSAQTARNSLTGRGWTITDGGLV